MSLLSQSIVQAFAESVAVGDVTPEAADALAPHLEVRLREIIQVLFGQSFFHPWSLSTLNEVILRHLNCPRCRMRRNSCGIPKGTHCPQRISTAP